EFSYTLIQGYDFLHLYREKGIALQLCGADQYGNCTSGIHLIKRLENADADVWSTPLVIDPASGRKFGKSEGNAIWLASADNGQGNYTPVFDFYQFWLGQPDSAVEYLLKIYTIYDKETIDDILLRHAATPEQRIAQRALAKGVAEVVHGAEAAEAAITLTDLLFGSKTLADLTGDELSTISTMLPTTSETDLLTALAETGLATSKSDARQLLAAGAISINGEKVAPDTTTIATPAILKKGKNKFALVK
ncbi:tyrosine--tRNA ligase, partial [Candidatus Saccharibacteria bacterium]|nr:tyrosine--tRNA ligase [Candidatus Saccharibacteria bacterium]